jgi:hypothetical protein
MKSVLAATATAVVFTTSAFAQSSTTQPTGLQPNPNIAHQEGSSNSGTPGSSQTIANLPAAQKIRQDLQSAGFTDVKVMAESFVVQAKSKDGDPVLMTIGPRGMSVFEAMATNGGAGPTATTGSSTGSSTPNSSTAGSSTSSQPSNSGTER